MLMMLQPQFGPSLRPRVFTSRGRPKLARSTVERLDNRRNRLRRNGILNNELYTGRITYNRQRFVKDPEPSAMQLVSERTQV